MNVKILGLWIFAATWAMLAAPPAFAKTADEILGELKKQMNCEQLSGKGECIEFARGAFPQAKDADRHFMMGRTIVAKQKGGTEKIRVDFLSGPHKGARYAKELDFPTAATRENVILPDIDPHRMRRVTMAPMTHILGSRLPFMFLTLYGYFSGYGWELADGAAGGGLTALIGRPPSTAAGLPHVELRVEQRGRTHTLDSMLFFVQSGGQRTDFYKFAFAKYKKLPLKEVYRPMEVEFTFYLGKKAEVDRMRFDEWRFRVEPTQAETRTLSHLTSELSIPAESNLQFIK